MWWRRGGRWGRRARCVGDGGVDAGQAFGNVFGSWLAAFRYVSVDVVGRRRRAWGTGAGGFRRLDGFAEEGVVCGW